MCVPPHGKIPPLDGRSPPGATRRTDPGDRGSPQIRQHPRNDVLRSFHLGDGNQHGVAALASGTGGLRAHAGDCDANAGPSPPPPQQGLDVFDGLDAAGRHGPRFGAQQSVTQAESIGRLRDGESVVASEFRHDENKGNTSGDDGHAGSTPASGQIAGDDDDDGEQE